MVNKGYKMNNRTNKTNQLISMIGIFQFVAVENFG